MFRRRENPSPNEPIQLLWNGFVSGYASNIGVYLTFTLTLRSAHLYHQPYSPYQQFLYNTLSDLQDKGMNFTEIAHWMNEQGHKTSTGKVFRSGHVHSILKIYRIRKLRVEKEATSKLSKFDLYFVDKILINQT